MKNLLESLTEKKQYIQHFSWLVWFFLLLFFFNVMVHPSWNYLNTEPFRLLLYSGGFSLTVLPLSHLSETLKRSCSVPALLVSGCRCMQGSEGGFCLIRHKPISQLAQCTFKSWIHWIPSLKNPLYWDKTPAHKSKQIKSCTKLTVLTFSTAQDETQRI